MRIERDVSVEGTRGWMLPASDSSRVPGQPPSVISVHGDTAQNHVYPCKFNKS